MYNEFSYITTILIVFWVAFAIIDLAVAGIAALAGASFRKFFCWGLLSFLIPVLLIAYGALIGRNLSQVKKVEVYSEKLPASFDGYKIVQLSDIHSRSFRHRTARLQKMLDKAMALNPDLIVFTGDLITVTPDELDVTGPALSSLNSPDGVISILGNHDYCTRMKGSTSLVEPYEPAFSQLIDRERSLGWDILLNEHRVISRGADSIAVVGVENISTQSFFPSTGDLARASEGTDGMFRVLLSHDPTHWDAEVVGKDYPLTLSGHTHAMQVSIFGWCPSRFAFKEYRGLYNNGDQQLYVNIGLGETMFPARIGAVPEITLITLRHK